MNQLSLFDVPPQKDPIDYLDQSVTVNFRGVLVSGILIRCGLKYGQIRVPSGSELIIHLSDIVL